jgi:hypothetical protein
VPSKKRFWSDIPLLFSYMMGMSPSMSWCVGMEIASVWLLFFDVWSEGLTLNVPSSPCFLHQEKVIKSLGAPSYGDGRKQASQTSAPGVGMNSHHSIAINFSKALRPNLFPCSLKILATCSWDLLHSPCTTLSKPSVTWGISVTYALSFVLCILHVHITTSALQVTTEAYTKSRMSGHWLPPVFLPWLSKLLSFLMASMHYDICLKRILCWDLVLVILKLNSVPCCGWSSAVLLEPCLQISCNLCCFLPTHRVTGVCTRPKAW